ncbi:Epidermal growth factor receptor substrate 15 [Borealophlyctis nickersoniae]|nr:Epidermal growth factor receptor substrate 15 [Borealophlyctis nickersoniae]
MQARALYACQADSPQELSFNGGDVIVDVAPAEDADWFTGRIQGTQLVGLFPGNYVKFEEEAPPLAGNRFSPGANIKPAFAGGVSASAAKRSFSVSGPTGTPSHVSGLRRDTSASSLPEVTATGFGVQLRKTGKGPVLANNDESGAINSNEVSESVARAKQKVNPYATRLALMERSNEIVQSAKDKALAARANSISDGGARSKEPHQQPNLVPPAVAANVARSLNKSSGEGTSGVAALRGVFGGNAVGGVGPEVPKRPSMLVSNQSLQPPALPSRSEGSDQEPGPRSLDKLRTNAPVVPKAAKPPPSRKPAELKATETQVPAPGPAWPARPDDAPARPIKPSEIRAQLHGQQDTNVGLARLVKPSELRAQQSQDTEVDAPRLVKPSELKASQGGATTPPKFGSSHLPKGTESARPSLPARPAPPPPKSKADAVDAPPPMPARHDVMVGYPALPSRAEPSLSPAATPPLPARPGVAQPPQPPRPKPAEGVAPSIPARPPQHASYDPNGLTESAKTIPPDARRRYETLFDDSDRDQDGLLNGEDVRRVWLRSGLDNRTLGLIWNLADVDEDGFLTRDEFSAGQ